MNKLIFFFAMIFGCAVGVNAQTSAGLGPTDDGFGLPVKGYSTEVQAWQEECRRTDNIESGTCIVTVRYQSDYFPVKFIQGDKVLEQVDSAEAGAIGFEAVQGVEYEALPNGGMKYVLEIRSPKGATFIFTEIGS